MLELAILGLVSEQPLHGYELKKRLSELLGALWGVSYGSLYPALRRLERQGAIENVDPTLIPAPRPTAIPATGSLAGEAAAARRARPTLVPRRVRKAYRITPTGEAMFTQLMTADSSGDTDRVFAVKLAFFARLDAPARLTVLERHHADLAARRAAATRSRGPLIDRYARALLEHRASLTERDLQWVDELIAAELAGDSNHEGVTA
ncbi:MAG: PadR family transcriptional regulator [Acidimicrobiia bacterium]